MTQHLKHEKAYCEKEVLMENISLSMLIVRQ